MAYYSVPRDLDMEVNLPEEKYTYKQAYIDLFQIANYKEWSYKKQNWKIITIPIWSIWRSETRLWERWMWDRRKVSRFLDMLEAQWQIVQQNIWGNDWIISLIWYIDSTTNGTTKSTTKGTTNGTYKKEEQIRTNKNNIDTPLNFALEQFYEYRKWIKKPMKDRAKKLLDTELEKLAWWDDDKKIRLLNNAILKWRLSVYPEKWEQPLQELTDLQIWQLWEKRYTPEWKEVIKQHQKQLDKYTPEQLNDLRKKALLHFVQNA